jgi:uncharacterized protein
MNKKIPFTFLSCLMWLFAYNALAVNPERSYKYSPEDFHITSYTENFITTADNFKIKSWEFIPERNIKNQVIIISNGDAGNMAYSLYYVAHLLRSGYTVITYDYRGFGESDDFETQREQLYYKEFARDLKAVLAHTKQKFGAKNQIGLMSFSMGSIINSIVLQQEQVDFLIAENYVLDPDLVVKRYKEQKNKDLKVPEQPIDFQKAVNNIKCPMLLFAGKEDSITTIADAQKIVEAQSSIRKLVTHEKGHGQGLLALTKERTGDVYFQEIESFLSTVTVN